MTPADLDGPPPSPAADEVRIGRVQGRLAEAAAFLQVTTQDVVELCGAKPWTVNQWRKRADHPFPAPTAGGRSPMFNLAEVLAWLDEEAPELRIEPSPAWYWCRAIDALPAATDASQRSALRGFVASFVALGAAVHGRLDAGDDASVPRSEVPTDLAVLHETAAFIEQRSPVLRGLLASGLEPVAPAPQVITALGLSLELALLHLSVADGRGEGVGSAATDPAMLLDDALEILGELAPDASATHDLVAGLMAEITARWPAASVLDPACGEAVALSRRAVRTAASPSAPSAPRLLGVEREVDVARIAQIRLALRHLPAEIRTADALVADVVPAAAFDLVLLDPPTGASSGGIARWVGLATRSLAPDGRGVLVVPASSLRRNAAAAELLRQRVLAAVVLLPPGVRHGARDTQALAVITAMGACEEVLVIDLRSHRRTHGDPPIGDIATLIGSWIDGGDVADASLADFTARTRHAARRLDAYEALAAGVLAASASRPPDELHQVIEQLVQIVDAHRALPGSTKLLDALRSFARANDLPDPGRRDPPP